MMKLIKSKLSFYLAFTVFLLVAASLFGLFLMLGLLVRFNMILDKQMIVYLVGYFTISTAIFNSLLFIVTSNRVLTPIKQLRTAMNQVAKGQFDLSVPENQPVEEMRSLMSDFNKMVKELGSIDVLRNDFISNLSHEFKTPTAAISGFVQLLQTDNLSDTKKQEYYERILSSTHQLSNLTSSILNLSKLEQQTIDIEQTTYQLDEQIREVILFLQPKWEYKHLDLDINMPSCVITGNEELLYQVWLNALDNAIKYNQMEGVLNVTLTQTADNTTLTIYNTGMTIHPEEKQKVFDKFYQGKTSQEAGGNGLGLALSKKIISLHKGSITIDSPTDEGTVLAISLPNLSNEKGICLYGSKFKKIE